MRASRTGWEITGSSVEPTIPVHDNNDKMQLSKTPVSKVFIWLFKEKG
jgi:hypothetical protein